MTRFSPKKIIKICFLPIPDMSHTPSSSFLNRIVKSCVVIIIINAAKNYLMYLGYYFKDIPVGTVFQDEKYGTFYVVEGILQKNASIVDSTALEKI